MKIRTEIDEQELKKIALKEMEELLGDFPFNPQDVKIETKSKQNYKSERETDAFRAVLEKN